MPRRAPQGAARAEVGRQGRQGSPVGGAAQGETGAKPATGEQRL